MKSTDDTAPESPEEFRSYSTRRLQPGQAPSDAALRNEDQRTNVVFKASAWDHIAGLDDEDRDLLRWFHLHVLERSLSNAAVGRILGYDRTTAFRILNGTYPSRWATIVGKVRDYRAQTIDSASVPGIDKEPAYVPTAAGAVFWQGLDMASRGGFVILVGESGAGKTKTIREWDAHHPGRLIRFNAPVTGGHVSLIRDLGHRLGCAALSKVTTGTVMRSILARINRNQVLVIDQGSRLLPGPDQIRATSLEVLMEINEVTGCGIVIPLTWRAVRSMGEMEYQVEQITGRAEFFRAPQTDLADVAAIAGQYGQFTKTSVRALHELALAPGGLRTVAKVLSLADRMARFDKADAVTDDHVAAAIARRFENMGNENPFDR